MEVEKSHDPPSASWSPREAGGVTGGPESWRADGIDSSPSWRG